MAKKKTEIIYLDKPQVRPIGKVADDVDMGIWLTFKLAGKRKMEATYMLNAEDARRLGKKLLKAADKVEK